jgi:hypothetical protein
MRCRQKDGCSRLKLCGSYGCCYWNAVHKNDEPKQPDVDFEAQLGLFLHPWILLIGTDKIIEGLDTMVQAFETRRDTEFNSKG